MFAVGGTATGASATGLPPGVTGVYSAGAFTLAVLPNTAGTYNYTIYNVWNLLVGYCNRNHNS